jgi:Ca2+-binding EF-hand superfamily protein
MKNAHTHYFRTGAEVQADNIIDDMFQKLDADGGGTLDVGEITALFKENGIHMTEDQVANMFGEAQRMDACS